MTRDSFDTFCASLPATTHIVQWGNASVWKVGGKIFAICSTWGQAQAGKTKAQAGEKKGDRFSFKCSDLSYQILIEQDGLVPAPYLARAKWVAMEKANALSDDELKSYITNAHEIIVGKLTKTLRKELGLNQP